MQPSSDFSFPAMRSTMPRKLFSSPFIAVIVVGLNFLQAVLLARILGVAGWGDFSAAQVFSAMASGWLLLGVPQQITLQAGSGINPAAHKGEAVYAGLISGLIAAAGAMLLLLCFIPESRHYLFAEASIFILILPLNHSILAIEALHLGRKNFIQLNLSRLMLALIFPVLLMTLFYFSSLSVLLLTLCYAVSVVMVFVFCLDGAAGKTGRPWLSIRSALTVIRRARRFALANAAAGVLLRLDLLVVTMLATAGFQGVYMASTAIAQLMLVIPGVISFFALKAGARGQTDTAHLIKNGLGLLLIQCLAGIALYFISLLLIPLVFGAEFAGASEVLPALITAYGLTGLCLVIEGHLQGSALLQMLPKITAAAGFIAWVALIWPQQNMQDIAPGYAFFCGIHFLLLMGAWFYLKPQDPDPSL